MQALGLVRIFKKQDFVEISIKKSSECNKMGLVQKLLNSYSITQSPSNIHQQSCYNC